MFIFLESVKEIAEAQATLESTLRREFSQKVVRNIGYPGGTEKEAGVVTNGAYWFWSADHRKAKTPRRLNWFGRYSDRPGTSISVEINVAYRGRNDRAAGFFARDSRTGAIYLMHSGRVGGGRKGVGKGEFCAWINEALVEVIDSSGSHRSGLLVMPIEGKSASRSAERYFDSVDRFKRAVRAGEIATPAFQKVKKRYDEFYAEARGRRIGKRSGEIDYLSRHGEVVDALRAWRGLRPMRKGTRIVKDVLIDMGVEVGQKLLEVFEVKTGAERSLFYTGLGQLMVHGSESGCQKTLVLPQGEVVAPDLLAALERLDVRLLRFRMTTNNVTIVDA